VGGHKKKIQEFRGSVSRAVEPRERKDHSRKKEGHTARGLQGDFVQGEQQCTVGERLTGKTRFDPEGGMSSAPEACSGVKGHKNWAVLKKGGFWGRTFQQLQKQAVENPTGSSGVRTGREEERSKDLSCFSDSRRERWKFLGKDTSNPLDQKAQGEANFKLRRLANGFLSIIV